jgi:hypothetical protein
VSAKIGRIYENSFCTLDGNCPINFTMNSADMNTIIMHMKIFQNGILANVGVQNENNTR